VDDSSSSSAPDAAPTGASSDKWLVRILLGLAFGLAFGIEGMTLVRSYVLDRDVGQTTEATEQRASLREGDVLVPGLSPGVRVQRLRVQASDDAWTFRLRARPDSALTASYTLSFDRLTTADGDVRDDPIRHTWTPGDTASVRATWALPPGQRPASLTMTATVEGEADSIASGTRTVDVGHVPVRRQ
jgi:hypothetical protein